MWNIIQSNRNKILTNIKYPEDFVNKLIKVFDEYDTGISGHEDFVKNYGQNMLLCRKNGAVYHIDPLLAISEIPENVLWAEGSGADFAVGAGFASTDKSSEERIKLAVGAAIEYSTSCGGSIFYKKL